MNEDSMSLFVVGNSFFFFNPHNWLTQLTLCTGHCIVAHDCLCFLGPVSALFLLFRRDDERCKWAAEQAAETCARKQVWREKRVSNLKGQGCVSSQSVFESSHLMNFSHVDRFPALARVSASVAFWLCFALINLCKFWFMSRYIKLPNGEKC